MDDTVREEVKRQNRDSPYKQFEQRMKEEEEVRVDWLSGKFEEGEMVCETCGDKHAWDRSHACCSQQCSGILNALQAFPFSALDDVTGAKLDPAEVIRARKVEIGYAEKKPVWTKILDM